MKTTLPILGVCLSAVLGCEYDVREEPLPGDDHSYEGTRPPAPAYDEPASAPPPPARTGASDASDASAAPASSCEGSSVACSDVDVAICESQGGCWLSLDRVSCTGTGRSCSMIETMTGCERQLGCTWVPR